MLDLRKPIAYFFLINALILIGYGLASPHSVPLGDKLINLDAVWGGVMGVFGALMFGLAKLDRTHHTEPSHQPLDPDEAPEP